MYNKRMYLYPEKVFYVILKALRLLIKIDLTFFKRTPNLPNFPNVPEEVVVSEGKTFEIKKLPKITKFSSHCFLSGLIMVNEEYITKLS